MYSCHWKVTCNIRSGHWELFYNIYKKFKNFSVTEHLLASLLTRNLQLCNRRNSHREFNIWWNISEQLFYRTNVNGCFCSENFSNSSCSFSYHLHQIPHYLNGRLPWTEWHFARYIRSFQPLKNAHGKVNFWVVSWKINKRPKKELQNKFHLENKKVRRKEHRSNTLL